MCYNDNNNNNEHEWEPGMFSNEQVKEIEEAWQCAAAVMTHFHVHDNVRLSDLLLDGDDDEDATNEGEQPLLTLSPTKRLSTPQGYENRDDIVHEAVRRDPRALVWASRRLRDNGYLWLPDIRRHAVVVRYLSSTCRHDSDFCLEAVQVNPNAIFYISRPCCYNPHILRAAWQGTDGDELSRTSYGSSDNFHHRYAHPTTSSFQPLFAEDFPGEHTGSLVRYATFLLNLDRNGARQVAMDYHCVDDFDRWHEWQIMQVAAKHHPKRLAHLVTTVYKNKHHHKNASLGKMNAAETGDKSPLFLHLHKSTSLAGSWSGRARHVRKLSETQ